MEKFEYEGEIYYYANNKFLDSSFIEVGTTLAKKLTEVFLLKEDDYTKYNEENMLNFIKKLKEGEQYSICKKVCMFALEKFDGSVEFIRWVLPILFSCLRNLKQPSMVVSFKDKYYGKQYESVAMLTSLAAAYCDLQDYKNAKKYADIAYARQSGGVGYTSELSLVYARIKSLSGIGNDFEN